MGFQPLINERVDIESPQTCASCICANVASVSIEYAGSARLDQLALNRIDPIHDCHSGSVGVALARSQTRMEVSALGGLSV